MIRDKALFQSPEFVDICRGHQVKELYVFGSVGKGTDTDKSDIDLLVDIDEKDPIKRGKLLLSVYAALQSHFNKKVDLHTTDSIRNPTLRDEIANTKVMVYAREQITTYRVD